jgi:hypothetical protein
MVGLVMEQPNFIIVIIVVIVITVTAIIATAIAKAVTAIIIIIVQQFIIFSLFPRAPSAFVSNRRFFIRFLHHVFFSEFLLPLPFFFNQEFFVSFF